MKHKERILKATREKQQVTYKGNLICLTADLSAETLQPRREWQDIFEVLKGENIQPRLLYLARISLKIDGEIKSFSDKPKLREFRITKPAVKKAECQRTDAFELWCWRRLLRVPWPARRSNQSILKEISPGCFLE